MPRSGTLTRRELEVIRLIAEGLTDKEIAVRLGIARGTVSNHVSALFVKLDVTRRTEAVSYAFRRGLMLEDEVFQVEHYRVDDVSHSR